MIISLLNVIAQSLEKSIRLIQPVIYNQSRDEVGASDIFPACPSYTESFGISSQRASTSIERKVIDLTWCDFNATGECFLKFQLWHFLAFCVASKAALSSDRQCKRFGLEGDEMWLATSADRRVSVWAASWLTDKCDLLDWLTFPAPTYTGVLYVF